jgi:hypothetical protein
MGLVYLTNARVSDSAAPILIQSFRLAKAAFAGSDMRFPVGARAGFLLTVGLCVAKPICASIPIFAEDLRLQVLASIFPGMEVERISQRTEDSSLRIQNRWRLVFPDALVAERLYRVTGPPLNQQERCAAEDMLNRKTMDSREVRFQIYPWPGSARDKEILAIVQYRFDGAKPSASCTSIAALFRLAPAGKNWEIEERYLLDTAKHHHLEGIQLTRVTGAGDEELVIESDSGDGNRFASDLRVFNLARGRFLELLNVPSRIYIAVKAEAWTQDLDIPRTLTQQGDQFCFVKTVYAAEQRWFATPLVTKPCYARGEGVAARR